MPAFQQDGLTGSAWGDWANYTASPLRAFENELGVQALWVRSSVWKLPQGHRNFKEPGERLENQIDVFSLFWDAAFVGVDRAFVRYGVY